MVRRRTSDAHNPKFAAWRVVSNAWSEEGDGRALSERGKEIKFR